MDKTTAKKYRIQSEEGTPPRESARNGPLSAISGHWLVRPERPVQYAERSVAANWQSACSCPLEQVIGDASAPGR
jgi:hypothetical protein